ncbi:hypothetical protein KM043_005171 [Ampulex compressa]|nr:hypothetical protein KM043_005171 [Ampulex compressa]
MACDPRRCSAVQEEPGPKTWLFLPRRKSQRSRHFDAPARRLRSRGFMAPHNRPFKFGTARPPPPPLMARQPRFSGIRGYAPSRNSGNLRVEESWNCYRALCKMRRDLEARVELDMLGFISRTGRGKSRCELLER